MPALLPMTTCVIPDLFKMTISGQPFSILRSKLDRVPHSRLSLLAQTNSLSLCDGLTERDGRSDFFFDRSSTLFETVINVYRTGVLHLPFNVCSSHVLAELEYWMIDLRYLAPCCKPLLARWKLGTDQSNKSFPNICPINGNNNLTLLPNPPDTQSLLVAKFLEAVVEPKTMRERIWTLLEAPNSSLLAVLYMIYLCTLVVTTVAILIVSSMSELQSDKHTFYSNDTKEFLNQTGIQPALEVADAICVTWLSADYLLRIWASPDRRQQIRSPLSLIDLFAVLPFYVETILSYLGLKTGGFGDFRRSMILLRALRILRVLRALRVLKVARYSVGFMSMGKTFKRSWRELLLLVLFTLTANLMFSTAVYYIEYDNAGSHFLNVPMASWWCIITMTTVGYGDVYPQTVAGKLLGSIVSICGIIVLAFPISIMVENFNDEYERVRLPDESTSSGAMPFPRDGVPSARTSGACSGGTYLCRPRRLCDEAGYAKVKTKKPAMQLVETITRMEPAIEGLS